MISDGQGKYTITELNADEVVPLQKFGKTGGGWGSFLALLAGIALVISAGAYTTFRVREGRRIAEFDRAMK